VAEPLRAPERWKALGLAVAFLLAIPLLGPDFLERWRLNNPSRLVGLDSRLDAAALEAMRLAAQPVEGASLSRRLDPEKGIDALAAISRASPWAPGPWLRRGSLLGERGRIEEALACFDAARAIDPRNASLRLALGDELFLLRGAEAALADHRAAVELDVRASGETPSSPTWAPAPIRSIWRIDWSRRAPSIASPTSSASWSAFPTTPRPVSGAGWRRAWSRRICASPGVAGRYLARLYARGDRELAAAERRRILADAWGIGDVDALPGLRLAEGGLFNHDFLPPMARTGLGGLAQPDRPRRRLARGDRGGASLRFAELEAGGPR
jgi:tetratricopeptide (TPR) repeat protein